MPVLIDFVHSTQVFLYCFGSPDGTPDISTDSCRQKKMYRALSLQLRYVSAGTRARAPMTAGMGGRAGKGFKPWVVHKIRRRVKYEV